MKNDGESPGMSENVPSGAIFVRMPLLPVPVVPKRTAPSTSISVDPPSIWVVPTRRSPSEHLNRPPKAYWRSALPPLESVRQTFCAWLVVPR